VLTLTIYFIALNVSVEFVLIYRPHPVYISKKKFMPEDRLSPPFFFLEPTSTSLYSNLLLFSGCDGLRNKVKYVPLSKFSQLDLVSDFRLLEGASAQIDK
jgi:hypothetical protein